MKKVFVAITVVFVFIGAAGAQEMKPLGGDLIVVERQVEGSSEKAAIDDAARAAVQSCVGRVYFSKRLIMARSLLTKYLDNYYKKFIFTSVVEDKKYLGDKVRLNLKTYVDYTKLVKDLEEKRFLFKPRVRPFFCIFLKEVLDGNPAQYKYGREMVRDAWKDSTGQREPENHITNPPENVDITNSPKLTASAIQAAQKRGAEIILTGTSSSAREKHEELYYDTYTFYRTTIDLKLIRVDTGEILDEAKSSSLAGSVSRHRAIQLSITRAAQKATAQLAEFYGANWDKTVHAKGDYQFLFTGVTDEKLDIIKRLLASLNGSSEVFVKNRYADVAVVNLVYKGSRELLINALEGSAYPRMHILKEEDNRFEIQIKN